MKRLALSLFFLPCISQANSSSDVELNAAETYKSVALATCLRKAFPNQDVLALDAMNSQSSLNSELKLPNDLESAEEVSALVNRFLAAPVTLQEKGKLPLKVLTCINLYHSQELEGLAEKYVGRH